MHSFCVRICRAFFASHQHTATQRLSLQRFDFQHPPDRADGSGKIRSDGIRSTSVAQHDFIRLFVRDQYGAESLFGTPFPRQSGPHLIQCQSGIQRPGGENHWLGLPGHRPAAIDFPWFHAVAVAPRPAHHHRSGSGKADAATLRQAILLSDFHSAERGLSLSFVASAK